MQDLDLLRRKGGEKMREFLLNFDYISGDPFIEAGRRVVINRIQKKQVVLQEIMELIKWALTFYVDKWHGKLNQISLNGTITQPAYKGKQKEKTIEYFNSVFENMGLNHGNCRTCGRLASLFPADRSIMPLTGSNTNPNFHPCFEKGIMICPECLVSLFFLPFAVMNVGNCLMINTISDELFECWLEETLMLTIGQNIFNEGIVNGKMKLLQNQLYELAKKFANLDRKILEQENIVFYYFTNFGASPECSLIQLPKGLVLFLQRITTERQNIGDDFVGIVFSNIMSRNSTYAEEWNRFIWKHYVVKKEKEFYDQSTNEYYQKNKKSVEVLSHEGIIQRYNPIIERLVQGKSILKNLRKSKISSGLAVIYCKEVLRMEKERIATLIQLADKIGSMIEKQNRADILINLEKCRNISSFRLALLKAMKRYVKTESEEPLFTTEDYLYRILPDGEPWTNARDLILIRLYERLHKWLAGQELDNEIETEINIKYDSEEE